MAVNCPACKNETLEPKAGAYRFRFIDPDEILLVGDALWWECSTCCEEVLPEKILRLREAKIHSRLDKLRPKVDDTQH